MSLTDAKIRAFRPNGQKQEYADDQPKGLWLIVGSTGTKSWVLRFKDNGKSRRQTLGTYPDLGLADARKEAITLKESIKKGAVPVSRVVRAETDRLAGMTVSKAFALYMTRYWGSKSRSEDSDKRQRARWAMFENDFEQQIGDQLLTSLTKPQIKKMLRTKHEAILARGMSGRGIGNVHAHLSAFLNWCVRNDDLTGLETNPMAGLEKLANGGERDRWLDRTECGFVLKAVRNVGGEFAAPLELLMRAGCRKSDIFNLTTVMVVRDNDELGPHLLIPDTKNGQDLVIPLVPQMLALVPEATEGCIWSCSGESTSRVKQRVDDEVTRLMGREIAEWRLHDLRTTVGSHLDTFGTDDRVIEKILCHKEPNKAKRTYRRYGFFHEKKAALQQWNDLLDMLVAKVVEPEAVAA